MLRNLELSNYLIASIPTGPAGEPTIAATATAIPNAIPTITNRLFITYTNYILNKK